jgi:hypothetical protein
MASSFKLLTLTALTPAATGLLHFRFHEPDNFLAWPLQCLCNFEDSGQGRLLLTEFEDADIGSPQISVKA